MYATNLHHLGVPCIVGIREVNNLTYKKDDIYYLNPSAIIRYEPGGAVITPPMFYSSFIFVDDEVVNLLKKKAFSCYGIPENVVLILLENEVISTRKTSDQEYHENKVEVNGLPTQVLFEVTSLCNCDCIACYHKLDLHNYSPPLEHLLQRICKLKELGIGLFEVTGGEPLLRDDLWEILDFIHKSGLHFYVVTNGEYLRDISYKTVDVLKKGLGLAVSLDGVGEVHDRVRQSPGLYDKMMQGLDHVFSKGVKIYFIATLNRENVNCAREMVAVAKKFNTTVHFRPTIKTGAAVINAIEQIDLAKELGSLLNNPNVRNGLLNTKKVIPEAHYYGCGIRKRISVDSHGILYPCVMDRTRFLGNIEWYSPGRLVQELEKETLLHLEASEKCKGCVHNEGKIRCGGFCRFSNVYKQSMEKNYGKMCIQQV